MFKVLLQPAMNWFGGYTGMIATGRTPRHVVPLRLTGILACAVFGVLALYVAHREGAQADVPAAVEATARMPRANAPRLLTIDEIRHIAETEGAAPVAIDPSAGPAAMQPAAPASR
jgi:hypothetical protein